MKKLLFIFATLLSLVSCSTPDDDNLIIDKRPTRTIEISRGMVFQFGVNGVSMNTPMVYNNGTYSATFKCKVGDTILYGGGIPDKNSNSSKTSSNKPFYYFTVKNNGVVLDLDPTDDNGPDGYPMGLTYIVE